MGEFDPLKAGITSKQGSAFEKDYLVTQFLVHPDFDEKRLSDNIAILALDKPVNLVNDDNVNAACIPTCNNMFDHSFANNTGVRCWSAGFRGQGLGKEKKSVLRKVDIPIYPDRAECQKKINTALKIATGREKIKEVELTPGEICAG